MAAIKSVVRSATVAFAPTLSDVVATGTMAGAIDQAFSASASLDLFKLDFSSPDQELPIISTLPTSEKFNRLSWGITGVSTGEYPHGLIAGGLADGSIDIWNPDLLLRNAGEEDNKPLLARLQKHGGPVHGLDFSAVTSNFLASGGDDGELCIWDLEKPFSPSLFPPLKGGGSGGQGEISYLSWNRKVGHILASASYSGAAVVWDLKRQKPVISLTDPTNRRRCSVLQWNPDLATQLIVASDDDRSPSLQVWDLRNSVSPLKELAGHTKGVLAMAWSPTDSAFLLTCAKDNRTICWDVASGEIVCELPVSSNWNFDVQWSPRVPGILSTSSFDGKVSIFNIEGCTRILPSEGAFGAAGSSQVLRAPKWLKRPAGVTFGFGGKLISFSPRRTSGGTVTASEIRISTVVTEKDLVARSKEFEAAIADGEKSTLWTLCETKIQSSGSQDEKELWSFLKMKFESDFRTSLLSYLGFVVQQSEDNSLQKVVDNHLVPEAEFSGKMNLDDVPDGNLESSDYLCAPHLDASGDIADDGSEFFNNLDTPKGSISPRLAPEHDKKDVNVSSSLAAEPEEVAEEDDNDRAIQHSLVGGDYQGAVNLCLSANRMADALVLAHVGGAELWNKTLNAYLRSNQRPYSKVISAVIAHDTRNLVESRSLDSWKETLALLCSYAQDDDWSNLCDALAARLDRAGKTQAATLCYICAGNIEKAVQMWSRGLCLDSRDLSFLQDLMEKVVVMALASGKRSVNSTLARLVASYAELLANEGLLQTAINYLYLVPPELSSEDLVILQNRICNSGQVAAASDKKAETATFQVQACEVDASPSVALDHSGYLAPQELAPSTNVTSFSTYPAYPQSSPMYAQSSTQQQTMYSQSNVPYNQATSTQVFYPSQAQAQQIDDKLTQQQGLYFQSNIPYNQATAAQDFYQPQNQSQQIKTFVPTNPPPIPNLEQFHAPTSSFQGLPGASNTRSYPPSSLAPTAAQMPNMMLPGSAATSVTSTPPTRGFIPVPSSVGPQQPTIITPPMQPQSPSTHSGSASPASAPAPVPTIYTADTSNVAEELKPVIATLTRLFNETSEGLGGARAIPAKKREIDDNSKKLGTLFVKLNSADISVNAATKLIQLCQSLDAGDYSTALHIQVGLTTSDWDECSFWLAALKRMIKTRQSLR